MTGSMTFIDLRETVPDKLRMIEMHNVPELILRQTGADDILRRKVEEGVLANVISFRHLAQIGQTNLSDVHSLLFVPMRRFFIMAFHLGYS